MAKIGIFYAPKGGSTEKVAQKVHKHLPGTELFSVPEAGVNEMMQFDHLIMGIATIGKETWDQKIKKSGWDLVLPHIDEADFSGKKVAIFGLGDSVTYDLQFVDAIGILGRKLRDKGAELIGFVPTKDYSFRESEAVEGDMFMGLPIDEDFEEEKTDERIASWIEEITKKMS
jgi:flavodoxin I